MKTVPALLATHLAQEVTTLAICIKLVRADGEVFGFTTHIRDLTIDAVLYQTVLGFEATAVETTSALNVDTLEIKGYFDILGVTLADVISGVWDFTEVYVFQVNYADVSMGTLKQRRGFLGEISATRSYTAEMRGLAQKLQQEYIELTSMHCKADLFDARCKIVDTEGQWKFSGVAVGAVSTPLKVFSAAALVQAEHFFAGGKVQWTTGANAGLRMEVKSFAATVVTLAEFMPYVIAPGDTFTIWAGCLKRYSEDCRVKFNNHVNFRGFPHLPGIDFVYRPV